jgi:hypothetical protein
MAQHTYISQCNKKGATLAVSGLSTANAMAPYFPFFILSNRDLLSNAIK